MAGCGILLLIPLLSNWTPLLHLTASSCQWVLHQECGFVTQSRLARVLVRIPSAGGPHGLLRVTPARPAPVAHGSGSAPLACDDLMAQVATKFDDEPLADLLSVPLQCCSAPKPTLSEVPDAFGRKPPASRVPYKHLLLLVNRLEMRQQARQERKNKVDECLTRIHFCRHELL